jgi:uncharacterized protein YggE
MKVDENCLKVSSSIMMFSKSIRIERLSKVAINCFFAFLGIIPVSVLAQDPQMTRGATISVTTAQDVVLVPSKLRLTMLVRVESRDSKRALETFREHQDRVTSELNSLGAIPSSVEFSKPMINVGIPGVDDPDSARKQARQQAAQMRNLNPQRARLPAVDSDEEAELPSIYTASSKLTAEWALDENSDDANLLLPSTIRSAIQQNDFKGKNHKVVLNPEEQQLILPLMGSYSYASSSRVPEIQLVYVARLSEAQEEDAIKQAFKKGQAQAAMLARAMGKRLAGVRSISSSTPLQLPNTLRNYEIGPNGQLVVGSARRDSRESIQEDASNHTLPVAISIQFEME